MILPPSLEELISKDADKEDSLPDPPDFTTIDTEKVKDTVEKLNKVLNKNKQACNKAKSKIRYISKKIVVNIEKYEVQERDIRRT